MLCPVVTRVRFCRLKKREREVDHVSPFNAKIKDAWICICVCIYRGADKSLARPTSRCILFDGENISFDASLVICI